MKSKLQGKPVMQKAKPTNPEPQPTPVTTTYSPSVPISVYRQVVQELQTTKESLESLQNRSQASIEALKFKNQELSQQNQTLRVEIERVVQSALRLRQMADDQPPVTNSPAEAPSEVEVHFEATPTISVAAPVADNQPQEQLIIEQPVAQPRPLSESGKASEIKGWWLMLAILLIVTTAFGVGFVVVRPLLPSR